MAETARTADTAETAETADTARTADTAETARTAETAGTARAAGTAGTAETAGTVGTAETAETTKTSETTDTADTAETWNWRGGRIREAFLEAARTAADLLAEPAVARAWDGPSVLEKFTVRGLAGHMFWQELALPALLADPLPAEPVVPLRTYYLEKVIWLDAGPDAPVSGRIRQGGEATAADGHTALHARVREALDRLRTEVPAAPAARPVHVPSWGDWSLNLDDFLLTRLLELVVHTDDLACSTDLPTPAFPDHVTAPAIDLLTRLSTRRHGPIPLLRALARRERAPGSIAGI